MSLLGENIFSRHRMSISLDQRRGLALYRVQCSLGACGRWRCVCRVSREMKPPGTTLKHCCGVFDRFLLPVLMVALVVPSFLEHNAVHANPEAKRLYEDLLSTYNRLIRPVGNNSDKLTVKLGLKLSQLIDVVSKYNFFNY